MLFTPDLNYNQIQHNHTINKQLFVVVVVVVDLCFFFVGGVTFFSVILARSTFVLT